MPLPPEAPASGIPLLVNMAELPPAFAVSFVNVNMLPVPFRMPDWMLIVPPVPDPLFTPAPVRVKRLSSALPPLPVAVSVASPAKSSVPPLARSDTLPPVALPPVSPLPPCALLVTLLILFTARTPPPVARILMVPPRASPPRERASDPRPIASRSSAPTITMPPLASRSICPPIAASVTDRPSTLLPRPDELAITVPPTVSDAPVLTVNPAAPPIVSPAGPNWPNEFAFASSRKSPVMLSDPPVTDNVDVPPFKSPSTVAAPPPSPPMPALAKSWRLPRVAVPPVTSKSDLPPVPLFPCALNESVWRMTSVALKVPLLIVTSALPAEPVPPVGLPSPSTPC